ncbi:MAG: thiamine pyrophosphate-dependent enzyme, partial [Chitinophagaceae bacterium]
ADPDVRNEPHSGGRQMNAHLSSPFVNDQGDFLDLVNRKNLTAGLAPTAAQMPKAVGLAFASKTFRQNKNLQGLTNLSDNGNEVCFCTIGESSTSEGHFWEAANAAGVMQVPLAIFVWDDGYGISVPKNLQTTKGSISEALKGLQKKDGTNGIDIYKVKGWDYAALCEAFEVGLQKIRETHTPALFHVEELTQPQGHSSSGSHERYKSAERLAWEKEWDCIRKMKEWIIENALADEDELTAIQDRAKDLIRKSRNNSWEKYFLPLKAQKSRAIGIFQEIMAKQPEQKQWLTSLISELNVNREPTRKDIMVALQRVIQLTAATEDTRDLRDWYSVLELENKQYYNSHLYHEGPKSPLQVKVTPPVYDEKAPVINGYEILNRYFDQLFSANNKVIAFGEDLGVIGDVNQGFSGLQQKHGVNRIFDTGIRELTIMGQGIGLALRGLRPITEIQYLDYLLYGLQPLSDDLASLHYRTVGRQSAPLIVRTRGHRLEDIWHSGSPMGVVINALRGMHVCVPRNMVQAAGMYNTLLKGNDPAIVIESLNGYRLKEKLPSNLLDYTVPLGVPEMLVEGTDITLVSYGSTLRIVQEAVKTLAGFNISCALIDVQTLLPFDIHHSISKSLEKTNRIIFIDEDVPGGAAAYMFTKVLEEQKGYKFLDAAPRTITGKAHRPAYATDGDYFSKPNAEQIVIAVREMMGE